MSNKDNAKTRKLKVYYGYLSNSYKRIPMIRVSGKYLAQSGFRIGTMIELTISEKCIVIKVK